MAVYAEKRDHGQEADAFVAIAVRVVFHESKRVRGREHGQVRGFDVPPLLLRSRQGGLEKGLVPNAWHAPLFAELVVVDGVDDRPA